MSVKKAHAWTLLYHNSLNATIHRRYSATDQTQTGGSHNNALAMPFKLDQDTPTSRTTNNPSTRVTRDRSNEFRKNPEIHQLNYGALDHVLALIDTFCVDLGKLLAKRDGAWRVGVVSIVACAIQPANGWRFSEWQMRDRRAEHLFVAIEVNHRRLVVTLRRVSLSCVSTFYSATRSRRQRQTVQGEPKRKKDRSPSLHTHTNTPNTLIIPLFKQDFAEYGRCPGAIQSSNADLACYLRRALSPFRGHWRWRTILQDSSPFLFSQTVILRNGDRLSRPPTPSAWLSLY